MKIVEETKVKAQALVQNVMGKVVPLAPDRWVPGGVPDPLIAHKHGLIGTSVSRLDGPLKVRGAARFAAERPMPDMVHAALSYATVAKGRIETLDTGAAEAAAGVVAVMTYRNCPRMNAPAVFGTSPTAAGPSDLPIMQDAEIHWNGQPIAVVLAETVEQAEHAASLVSATYVLEEATTSFAQARAEGTKQGIFNGEALKKEKGDAEAALARATHRVDQIYRTPRHNHNAIELHAATIGWEGDRLVIHDASQLVTAEAATIAGVFDLPAEQVHVTSPYVGGGFGGKCLWDHQILGAAAARLVGRPVCIALSREGVYRIVGGRTVTEQRVAIGADAAGRFTSIVHTGTVAMTAHNNMPEPFIAGTQAAYATEAAYLQVEAATMNMLANTFMRAPGEAVGTFALESAVDELAHAMGIDPIELRLLNEPDEDPLDGRAFSSRKIAEAWRAGADRFGWARRDPTPGAARDGDWLVGMGCATGT